MIFLFIAAFLFSVNPKIIEINEPVKVVLELPKDQKIESGALTGKLLAPGNFYLNSFRESEIPSGYRYEWELEAVASGAFPISLYKVESPNGAIYFPAYEVEVKPFQDPEALPKPPFIPLNPVIPPEISQKNQEYFAKIQSNQPAVNIKLLNQKAFPWMALFFTMGALVLLPILIWFMEREKKQDILTPEEEALLSLQKLETDLEAGLDTFAEKPLITKLSQTLRHFIHRKYALNAPHQTTEEFLVEVSQSAKVEELRKEKLGLFLKAADQVKFAGRTPSEHEIQKALNFARTFVGNTQ